MDGFLSTYSLGYRPPTYTTLKFLFDSSDYEGSDEQQYCWKECVPLCLNLHILYLTIPPFDSFLEFLLNLLPIFGVHRIEDELFDGTDRNVVDQTY